MALKFEIKQEDYDALEESQQALYDKHGDGYRLQVEGIDPADELKEALRKEREERAEAKRRLQEFETEAEKAERARLEKNQEWEQLTKTERDRAEKAEKRSQELEDRWANDQRDKEALKVTRDLTNDTAKAEILQEKASKFISYTPDGVKINGPDGDAWDAKKLSDHLREKYPFLVNGTQASGGGAAGSNKGGGATKKLKDMSEAERLKLKQDDPDQFKRLMKG